MFFLKKIREEISDLRDQIGGHQQMADMLLIKIQSHETSVKNLLDRSEEHASAIIEIDDKCEGQWSSCKNQRYEMADAMREERAIQISEISQRIDNLAKMQRAIATWIAVLCATSLFSFLIYFGML
jgi:cell division septum initiation protein DivIVA